MTETHRKAEIYVADVYAGDLYETDEGFVFSYSKEYLNKDHPLPVSLTMPLRAELYTSRALFPFFDGLIPEGWLLEKAVQRWKLDRRDRFGILLVTCYDCVGNVSVREVQV